MTSHIYIYFHRCAYINTGCFQRNIHFISIYLLYIHCIDTQFKVQNSDWVQTVLAKISNNVHSAHGCMHPCIAEGSSDSDFRRLIKKPLSELIQI